MQDENVTLSAVLVDWLERYADNQTNALVELINLSVRVRRPVFNVFSRVQASGCKTAVSVEAYETEQDVTILESLQDSLQVCPYSGPS